MGRFMEAVQADDIEGIRRHDELALVPPPRAPRAVGVDLDAEPIGVREVQGFAHQVVGHPHAQAEIIRVDREASERRTIR